MKRITEISAMLLALALLLPLAGCVNPKDEYSSRLIFAMDTQIEIYISADKNVEPLLDECEALIYELEAISSKTVETSDVSLLNRDGSCAVHNAVAEMLSDAVEISEKTCGAFDLTVGSAIALWEKCETENRIPSADETATVLLRVGNGKITRETESVFVLNDGATVDLGGIAKGYAADHVVKLIKDNEQKYAVRGGMLSFGGAVTVFGRKSDGKPYRIGIRDPENESGTLGYVTISEGNVSVSGAYQRYFTIDGKKYPKIIDPETCVPAASGISSVSVICASGELSDALSTALFVMGYEKATELYESGVYEFEAVFVLDDGTVRTTPGAVYSNKK